MSNDIQINNVVTQVIKGDENMAPNVEAKFQLILRKELKYTSANLGFNMLISKLQRKLAGNPGCMAECLKEADEFAAKFPAVVNADFAKIAAL